MENGVHSSATIPKSQHWVPLPAPLDPSSTKLPMATVTVDAPGFPCRRCLQEGSIGDKMLLVSYDPFLGDSAYRGASGIYVHKDPPCKLVEGISGGSPMPLQQYSRLLSVRAFASNHDMIDAEVVEGKNLNEVTEKFLRGENVEYLHLHNAKQGCFAIRIDKEKE